MRKLYCILIIGLMFVSGCVFSTRSLVVGGASSIYVPVFENDTYQPDKTDKTFKRNIENVVSDEIIRQFLIDGSVKIMPKELADLMLEGIITRYRKTPLTYSSTNLDIVEEYKIDIQVKLKLIDLRNNNVIWKDVLISRSEDYYVGGSTIETEDSALYQAAEDLAKDIIVQIVEAW
jgi:hypothetical protein